MPAFEAALEKLDTLARLARRVGLGSLAQELAEEKLPALRAGSLSVVVLGEFNHGKSTLLNALLGTPVLPVGITPTTACIVQIEYGAERSAAWVDMDGESHPLHFDALEETVREESERVRHVALRYPFSGFPAKMRFIDTPGVNDISQQRVEVTYGIVPRADLVVFVLDATQVLKRSELRFIEERLLSSNRDRLVFVLGKMDRLDQEEAREVERYARERLDALLGSVQLFPLSARRALNTGDGGFDAFKQYLSACLEERGELILLDSALSAGMRAGSALLGNLRIKQSSYRLAQSELESRQRQVQEKLRQSQRFIAQNAERIEQAKRELIARTRSEVQRFRDDFLTALPREIEKASADDVQRYLPGFIEYSFHRFLDREGSALARELERLAEEVIAVTNEQVRESVDGIEAELGLEALDIKIDSTPYDFSVFVLGAFGVSVLVFVNVIAGGLIALSTPVVAYLLRDRLDARVKTRATEAGMETIRQVSDRVEVEIVNIVDDFGERLRAFVEDAGDRLYRQIDEALRSVIAERADFGSSAEQLASASADAERELLVLIRAIENLRGPAAGD
ncbi:MAG: dynamin family protein [Myxococcota bacterium]|jgi:small GTP-binding protein|nr:dynamin family protein [Myxococcota bacterium]